MFKKVFKIFLFHIQLIISHGINSFEIQSRSWLNESVELLMSIIFIDFLDKAIPIARHV